MEMYVTKTHRFLVGAAAVSTLCLGAISVSAQETATGTDSTGRGENVREAVAERRDAVLENQTKRGEAIEARQASSSERQAQVEERQAERTEIREERRAVLAAFRQERIINLAANISNRMDAAILRLLNLISRLEARISKLEQAGFDTAAASAKLRDASQTLAEAKTALADIDALVYAATTSEQPRNDWQAVRERYVIVGNLIRQTHAELRETLALLKTAVSSGETGVSNAVRMNDRTGSSTPVEGDVMESI